MWFSTSWSRHWGKFRFIFQVLRSQFSLSELFNKRRIWITRTLAKVYQKCFLKTQKESSSLCLYFWYRNVEDCNSWRVLSMRNFTGLLTRNVLVSMKAVISQTEALSQVVLHPKSGSSMSSLSRTPDCACYFLRFLHWYANKGK